MLSYLDTELKNFISEYITSFLAWDILVHFQKNPGMAMNAEELASRLGRRVEDTERAAKTLAAKSVLSYKGQIFKYTSAEEMMALVDKFVQALDNREKRLLILSQVLRQK